MTGETTNHDGTATISGAPTTPPPGWARWTDHLMARLRARSIDDQLLNGGGPNGSAVVIVRRALLINRRHRSRVARALRKLIAAARQHGLHHFRAELPLRAGEILQSEPLILTLADELEHEERVSPRGVILADRLITDGDSPLYGPIPVSRPYHETVAGAVKHARAALHLG